MKYRWGGEGSASIVIPRNRALSLLLALGVMLSAGLLARGQSYSVLYSFQCAPSDAAAPLGTIVSDKAGDIYGISEEGGTLNLGAVFKLAPNGAESVLYSFAGTPDGLDPIGGLVRDAAGNLYGATLGGGAGNLGTVFRISPAGKELRLHSFGFSKGSEVDGAEPIGLLARDPAGNLYGLTNSGGKYKRGTLYQVTPAGQETLVYSFGAGIREGEYPYSGLLDSNGNFFGMTSEGGADSDGTVFEVKAAGTERVLHSFAGAPTDGNGVLGNLLRGSNGDVYGVTFYGGSGNCALSTVPGCGAVFDLNSNGQEELVYSFTGAPDGQFPAAGVVRDSAGNLYGTTDIGGTGPCATSEGTGCGTIYKITPSGQESVLYSFTDTPDGANPWSPLLLDSSGSLYGTTLLGGTYGCGTVFKYTP